MELLDFPSPAAVGAAPGPYTWSVRDSIDDRDPADWMPWIDGPADAMMDPRFLRAVERSLCHEVRFWNAVASGRDGRPAAAALLSMTTVDVALMARGAWGDAIRAMRRAVPGLLRVKLLLCGCPVSTGRSHLRLAPGADHAAILAQLDGIMCRLAREHGARWVAFKEFDEREAELMRDLMSMGYLRADSPPMNCLPTRFRDLDELGAAMRSHYRRKIVLSRRKFAGSGLRVEHLRGGDGVDRLYTDEVHRLYLSVLDRAEVKLECLPAEFFRELACQLPDESEFTFISKGNRVVAFSCGLCQAGTYQNLFIGYDPAENAASDLYFNLMLIDLDRALRRGVRAIHVGQTAEEFKSRVGCYTTPRTFAIKALAPAGRFALRRMGPYLFPEAAPPVERNLFKS